MLLKRLLSNYPKSLPKPINVLFFGSDEFSVRALNQLLELKHQNQNQNRSAEYSIENIEVVTTSSTSRTMSSGMRLIDRPLIVPFCQEKEIKIHSPPGFRDEIFEGEVPWTEYTLPNMNNTLPTLGVVVSFGRKLHDPLLDSLSLGAINLHPSLLPKLRGAAPIYSSMTESPPKNYIYGNGRVIKTGISVQEIHPKVIDAGNILSSIEYEIPEFKFYKNIRNEMADIGGVLLNSTIENLDSCRDNAVKQESKFITNSKKIKKNDGRIDWRNENVSSILRKWYAFGDTISLFSVVEKGRFVNKRVKLLDINRVAESRDIKVIEKADKDNPVEYGTVLLSADRNRLLVKCGKDEFVGNKNNKWISIKSLQVEGRRPLNALSFWNGLQGTGCKFS